MDPNKHELIAPNKPEHKYAMFSPTWSDCSRYEIIKKIGRGKYSEVFQGYDSLTGKLVVIKVLKAVKKLKIRREICILKHLEGVKNVIRLIDTCRDEEKRTHALIFEHVDNQDFKYLFPKFTDLDVRHFLYQLLLSLDACHAKGIMHRDVKPHNVMIDYKTRELRLIDWGLAEFYTPNQEYNVRVASRYFKGPELLLSYLPYGYPVDVWSFGCMMAGMIFMVHPFFHGSDNENQLVKIVDVLGFKDLERYLSKYGLKLPKHCNVLSQKKPEKKDFAMYRNKKNRHLCPVEALDLLEKVLMFDHEDRLTCAQAMQHSYFDPVRPASNNATSVPEE